MLKLAYKCLKDVDFLDLKILGKKAQSASLKTALLKESEKNEILLSAADALIKNADYIIAENQKDVQRARENGMSEPLIDRLMLNDDRIKAMSDGIRDVSLLADPVGEVLSENTRPNGLLIREVRVPIGVIGIIYESRPNVTSDAFALCFKSGNATILRGGSDAILSNSAITSVLRDALKKYDLEDAVCFVSDPSRKAALELMHLSEYVDLLIPRGGAALIKTVTEQSRIPVVETGTGNCHVYVDKYADIQMAADIIENAKTQRMGVCNACESLVFHKDIIGKALPPIAKRLYAKNIEIRGDEAAREICPDILPATEEDFFTEYLGPIISVKTVDSLDRAITHINMCHTRHSDCIVTADDMRAEKFQMAIDSAAVYHNASTRFTDGAEFGLGAEIGISTQKIHARGPMGLKALTSIKFVINGYGQVRK